MFTNNKAKYFGDNKVLIEAACLKTDTKPTTGIANGSKCIEMDTGKTYMFNEEDSEWEELPSSGGGGGGDGYLGLHTATVNVTFDTSSISGDVTEFEGAQLILLDSENEATVMDLWYDSNAIPVAELGSVTQMLIPVKDGYITTIPPDYLTYLANGNGVIATEITVVSGAATRREYDVAITGDCSLNIKVQYQE